MIPLPRKSRHAIIVDEPIKVITMDKEMYCCGCEKKVTSRLTDGMEIYPHRKDLFSLPFWKCDTCGNFVGCHYKTKNRTAPLGCIPTAVIRQARKQIHALIDPLWKSGQWSRKSLYAEISKRIGYKYHTANIRSIDEARCILSIAKELSGERITEEDYRPVPVGDE